MEQIPSKSKKRVSGVLARQSTDGQNSRLYENFEAKA